jgi:hypothetical protein
VRAPPLPLPLRPRPPPGPRPLASQARTLSTATRSSGAIVLARRSAAPTQTEMTPKKKTAVKGMARDMEPVSSSRPW